MNSSKKDLLILLISAIAAGTLLLGSYGEPEKFTDQALGEETSRYTAEIDGKSIQAVELSDSLFDVMSKVQQGKQVTLILGNSQTYSINIAKPGDVNYVQLLASDPGTSIMAHTIPNANLQEFWLLFNYWTSKLSVRNVLVPVFMDDLREDGIRTYFLEALRGQKYLIEDSANISKEINAQLLAFYEKKEAVENTGGNGQKSLTPQEISENALNGYLQDHSEIWRNRENARGEFFLALYNARNKIFGINAGTKRKMFPSLYRKNMQALELIFDTAKKRGIQVFVYIPPIRHDLELPYMDDEYARFKTEVSELAYSRGLPFRNFEQIIPPIYWGSRTDAKANEKTEIDYMHFQGPAHVILADSLKSFINEK